MKYRKGYKFQLAEDIYIQTDILPYHDIKLEFITLDMTGLLGLKSGYASDGCSGPMLNTRKALKG
jgi:hypothetical protein